MDTSVLWLCPRPELVYDGAEHVALLVGSRFKCYWLVSTVVHVPNRHTNQVDHFRVRASDVPAEHRDRVVGVIHSHPPLLPMPSTNDVASIPRRWLGAVCSTRGWCWYTKDGVVPVHERTPGP